MVQDKICFLMQFGILKSNLTIGKLSWNMLKIPIDLSWHDEPNLPALYQEEPLFLLEKSFQDDTMAMGLQNRTVTCLEHTQNKVGKYIQHFFGVIFQP